MTSWWWLGSLEGVSLGRGASCGGWSAAGVVGWRHEKYRQVEITDCSFGWSGFEWRDGSGAEYPRGVFEGECVPRAGEGVLLRPDAGEKDGQWRGEPGHCAGCAGDGGERCAARVDAAGEQRTESGAPDRALGV